MVALQLLEFLLDTSVLNAFKMLVVVQNAFADETDMLKINPTHVHEYTST